MSERTFRRWWERSRMMARRDRGIAGWARSRPSGFRRRGRWRRCIASFMQASRPFPCRSPSPDQRRQGRERRSVRAGAPEGHRGAVFFNHDGACVGDKSALTHRMDRASPVHPAGFVTDEARTSPGAFDSLLTRSATSRRECALDIIEGPLSTSEVGNGVARASPRRSSQRSA